MADETLKMEARLKNYISGQLGTIRKDLKKTEDTAKTSFSGASKGASAFMDTLKGFVGAAAIIGIARQAWSKLNQVAKESIDLHKIQTQAEAALASSLGYTSESLLKKARALQEVTTFGDEEIIQSQSLVAAFIREEDSINKLMPAILNLAAAKQMKLTAAADLVTKSVASTTNALARYGIEIQGAAGSTERINNAVGEINNAFGGMAKALAKTDVGKLEQMENKAGDLKERIGEHLIPLQLKWNEVIIKGLGKANELLDTIHETGEEIELFQILRKQAGAEFEVEQAQALVKLYENQSLHYEKKIEAQMRLDKALVNQKEIELEIRRVRGLAETPEENLLKALRRQNVERAQARAALEKTIVATEKLAEIELPIAKYFASIEKGQEKARQELIKHEEERVNIINQAEEVAAMARISMEENETVRQLEMLDLRYEQILSKYTEFSDEYNALMEAKTAERNAIINKQEREAQKEKELMWKNYAIETEDAAKGLQNALTSLARQAIADSKMEARKKKNILYAMAIADAAAAGVGAVKAAKDYPFPANVILAAISLAAIVALTAGQIANIKKATFHSGGIVGASPTGGSEVDVTALRDEMILTREQQGNLFRMIKSGDTNMNNQRTYNINLYGGATEDDADMIMGRLMELERDGYAEDYKGQLVG